MKRINKFLKINILLFVFLFLSISFNKEYLRPLYGHLILPGIILGSYPNFIAAFVIGLFPLRPALRANINTGGIIIYLTSLFIFIVLSIEEWKSFFQTSTVFDVNDIIASGLGSCMAIATFELVLLKRKKRV